MTNETKNIKEGMDHFDTNILATFAYLVPPFTGIIFYLLENNKREVKFHAFQSILFGIALFVLMKVSQVLRIVLIGAVLEPVISVMGLLIWLNLMWKAYNKIEFELPYIGQIARKQADK